MVFSGTGMSARSLFSEMTKDVQQGGAAECRKCGHCCGPYFALYVDEPDEERWKAEGRSDLLARLDWERDHVIWDEAGPFNCKTGERFEKCVFLERSAEGLALCSIHETKPKICRDYPPGSSELCALFVKTAVGGG